MPQSLRLISDGQLFNVGNIQDRGGTFRRITRAMLLGWWSGGGP
jgi:hypothetical protein